MEHVIASRSRSRSDTVAIIDMDDSLPDIDTVFEDSPHALPAMFSSNSVPTQAHSEPTVPTECVSTLMPSVEPQGPSIEQHTRYFD